MKRKDSLPKLVIIVGAILAGLAILAWLLFYLLRSDTKKPAPPPQEFSFSQGLTADDPNLPDALFGAANDDLGMPRNWLRSIDRGGLHTLKAEDHEAKLFWLLTNSFEDLYPAFQCYVCAQTSDKVVVNAFLLHPGGTISFVPLLRGPEPGAGVFRFEVPESQQGDHLLVSLAMKEESFDRILRGERFRVRSRLF